MIRVELPPPSRFRMAHDLDWTATRALSVVHVGQSGTLLAGTAESAGVLVPVTWGDRGLAPGGLGLDVPDAAPLRRELLHAVQESALIDLTGWSRVPADRRAVVDLRLPPTRIDAAALARLSALLTTGGPHQWFDPTMDPRPQREAAPALAVAVVTGDDQRVQALALDLIGSGPGATPAGDDVLVGALAGLEVAAGQQMLSNRARHTRRTLAGVVTAALDRTTAGSRHDLAAALSGSFSEHALYMTSAVSDVRSAEPAYRAALGWGATSGVDFLHGLVSTVDAALQHRPARLLAPA